MKTAPRYLQIESPDTSGTVDFMGAFPVTVKLRIDESGELWITATSATQDAPILLDEVLTVPPADEDED